MRILILFNVIYRVIHMPKPLPFWLEKLEDEDLQFIRRFVLASGSLKELAQQYSVSYPTLRSRLDRLIARIQAIEEPNAGDEFELDVRAMVAGGQLSPRIAKSLLKSHQSSLKKQNNNKGARKK